MDLVNFSGCSLEISRAMDATTTRFAVCGDVIQMAGMLVIAMHDCPPLKVLLEVAVRDYETDFKMSPTDKARVKISVISPNVLQVEVDGSGIDLYLSLCKVLAGQPDFRLAALTAVQSYPESSKLIRSIVIDRPHDN